MIHGFMKIYLTNMHDSLKEEFIALLKDKQSLKVGSDAELIADWLVEKLNSHTQEVRERVEKLRKPETFQHEYQGELNSEYGITFNSALDEVLKLLGKE